MNIQTILMAYRGSDTDKQALAWLCRLAKQTKANLILVYVLTVSYAHPVDAEEAPGVSDAERLLEEAEAIAQKEGVTVSVDLVQARDAGSGIISEAEIIKADLLVVTDRRHLFFMENPIGHGTVAYLFRNAPCPVWVCYPPEV
jgi:nucleotide-binding universal stress UspA family protein